MSQKDHSTVLSLDKLVAMCGSDVDHRSIPYKNRVWVFDNGFRNRQIVHGLTLPSEAGAGGYLPKGLKEKDINDMVLAGLDPSAIIKDNTFSGLTAKVKLTDWKKV